MLKKIFTLLIILVIAAGLWFANLQYPHPYAEKSFSTMLALAVIYLIFKVIFEEMITSRIKENKARYTFRKAVSIFYLVIFIVSLVAIWIESPEALLVTYGLLAAGIAVALQDLFKSIAGGLILFIVRPYKVGDRIEVDSRYGDVIDIGFLYTTILEMKGWVDGDQATGRLTIVPNYVVISSTVNNYTKDNEFIWDEIKIPLTYTSDWKAASKLITDIVKKETETISKAAQKDIARIQEKYFLTKRAVDPTIFIKITDNWIEMTVRFVTNVRERRNTHTNISRLILEKIQKSRNIHIASTTYDIVGMPEIKLKK